MHSFIHSLTHSFIHWLVYSFIHSIIHSLIQWLTYLFIQSFTDSFIHWLIHSFTHSLIHSLIHSFVQLFLHSLSHSFVYSLIHFHCLLYKNVPHVQQLYKKHNMHKNIISTTQQTKLNISQRSDFKQLHAMCLYLSEADFSRNVTQWSINNSKITNKRKYYCWDMIYVLRQRSRPWGWRWLAVSCGCVSVCAIGTSLSSSFKSLSCSRDVTLTSAEKHQTTLLHSAWTESNSGVL